MRPDGPNPPLGLAVLRVVLGVVFVAHGAPKLFGGVAGFAEALAGLGFPVPIAFAWIGTLLEFGGGLALIVGLFVTPIALLLATEMFLGIVLVHATNGFYVVGPGQGGIEFNLLLIAALLTLVFAGPGAAALGGRRSGDLIEAREPSDAAGDEGPGGA